MRRRVLFASLILPLLVAPAVVLPAQEKKTDPPPVQKRRPLPTAAAIRPMRDLGSELVVVVGDKQLEVPSQVDAGLVNVRLFNRSSGSQHISLLKIDRLDRLAVIADYLRSGDWNVSWINRMGGPESTPPGGVSSVSMVLEPGRYVIAQLPISPTPGGPLILGDLEELAVIGRPVGAATMLPPTGATVSMYEWNFDITGVLNAGRRTIRVENKGQFEHQVWIVRLKPGQGLEQAVRWAEQPSGEPPFEGVGGTTPLGTKRAVNVTVDLLPGDYALLCVTWNPLSKRLHSKHGMSKAIRVTR